MAAMGVQPVLYQCAWPVGSTEKETGIARDQCLGLLVHVSGQRAGDKV